jgi:hypothetical protein
VVTARVVPVTTEMDGEELDVCSTTHRDGASPT